MNNKKAGWTKTKWTSRTITGEELSKLRATHDVNIGAYGRVFIRKRNRQIPMTPRPLLQVNDQGAMLGRMKPVRLTNWKRMTKWLRKLLVITVTVLITTSLVYFDTDHYLSPLDGDKAVKLIPCHACKFTEHELEDFENKFKLQAVEAKKEEKKQEKLQTTKTDIERLVLETFGADNYDTAMCIVKHESGGRTDAVGDKHLMVYDPVHKEYVGDSIGIMQIRTGGYEKKTGKIWNRARSNGMTADEFREYLKDPKNNVAMGDKISGGGKNWGAWTTFRKYCN